MSETSTSQKATSQKATSQKATSQKPISRALERLRRLVGRKSAEAKKDGGSAKKKRNPHVYPLY